MAKTYTYSDALQFVMASFNRVLTDSQGATLCDQTNSMIWNAADWRSSLGSLEPFYLSPNEQDYGAPVVQVPTDFLGLRTATRVQMGSVPPVRDELNVKRYLAVTNLQGLPTEISYEPTVRKFRVWPMPTASMGAQLYLIEGTYKRTPTKVLAPNLASVALPWDDAYFRVFTSGLTYNYFASNADPRAGQVQLTKGGGVVYTGQLAVFMDALNEMAADEALNLGDISIAPAAPLVAPYRLF